MGVNVTQGNERMHLHLPLNLLLRDRFQNFYYAGFVAEDVRSFENLGAITPTSIERVEWADRIGKPPSTFHHRPCG